MPPERPDPRHVGNQIREALGTYDKDALAEILTHVFKEYVVEGPPPLVPSQPDRLEDLQGLSFAEVIAALQARLDLPELSFFEIEGSRVGVKVGGRTQWLDRSDAPRAPEMAAPASTPSSPPSGEPARRAPTPGVSVVETALAQRPQPAPPPAAVATSSAPRPARGLSVSSAPGGAQPASAAQSAQSAQSAQPGAPAAPRPAQPGKAEEAPSGASDDAAARFKLLEVD